MQKQRIINSDIEVSRLCLGTMTFGNPVGPEKAERIVHWALDHGINFIDTADMYEGYDRYLGSSGGVSETILGKALKGRRGQAVVTTKVGNPVGGSGYEGSGLSRGHILHQIDASLSRLQTDYVDIYELHRPDPETPLEESIAVVAHLIETGKVRYGGVSNFSGKQIREIMQLCDARRWPRPVVSQPPLSWLKRDALTDDIPVCREFELAVTPYQPLQGGLLTAKYRRGQPVPGDSRAAESKWLDQPDDAFFDQLEEFETEAREAGIQPAQYAVRWVLDQPGIVAAVIGVKSIDQLQFLSDACS